VNTSSPRPGDADNGNTRLRIYFAKGPGLRVYIDRLGWCWLLRRPVTLWELLGTEFIGFFWQSKARHVLIGQAGGVLDYKFCGVSYYPQDKFEKTYPGLIGWFEIPHDKYCHLSYFVDEQRPHWLRALVTTVKYYGTFLTFGLIPARTCVTITRDVLGGAGVTVPPRIIGPPRLAWWLMEQGYAFVPSDAATQRRSTD
jgi:hypothetical protein